MLSDQLRGLRRRFTLAHGGPLTISASQVDLVIGNLDRAIEEAEALEAQPAPMPRLRMVPGGANGFPNVVTLAPRPRAGGMRGNPFAPSTPRTPDMAHFPERTLGPDPDPELPPCA